MLLILRVLTSKVHPFIPENGVHAVYVPTRARKIVKSSKHAFGFYAVCVCIDRCALNAGECAHVCEGEARLMCRGEANTSTVALCLLARQA